MQTYQFYPCLEQYGLGGTQSVFVPPELIPRKVQSNRTNPIVVNFKLKGFDSRRNIIEIQNLEKLARNGSNGITGFFF